MKDFFDIDFTKYDNEISFKENRDTILMWTRNATPEERKDPEKEVFYGKIFCYHNCNTGKFGNSIRKVSDKLTTSYQRQSGYVRTAYYKATSDKKFLCVIICELSTRSIKPGEIRPWQEVFRFYVNKEKMVFYQTSDHSNTKDGKYFGKRYISESDLGCKFTHYKLLNEWPPSASDPLGLDPFKKEAVKVFGPIFTLSAHDVSLFRSPNDLEKFLKYKDVAKKDTPKQRRLDELTKIKLPSINDRPFIEDAMEDIRLERSLASMLCFATISRVKENVCCLRTFNIACYHFGNPYNYIEECSRIYITDKDHLCCKKNNAGEYVLSTLNVKDDQWSFSIPELDKDALKGTKLGYFADILEDTIPGKRSNLIKLFLLEPMLEQLYKNGLAPIIKYSMDLYNSNILAGIIEFTNCDIKQKSFYNYIGMNKYQLTKVSKYIANSGNNISKTVTMIACLKECLLENNISDVDNNTFDALFDYLDSFYTYTGYYYTKGVECFKLLNRLYSTKTAIKVCPSIVSVLKRPTDYITVLRYYTDYLSMVKELDDTRNFKPYFDSSADVYSMHEAVLTIYQTLKKKYEKEAFEKAIKKCEKFTYADENYAIIAPTSPGDFAKEGLTLHHCVKTYVSRVIDGSTNILFLRKISDIDTPFFTIEVSNNGHVEQIHGFGNRNISTEPDIHYFVKNWIKEKNLKKTDFDKIR